ncbi:MAG: tetratricopeptide repeat protein [Methanoregula sp.]|nr:tetratricopeptide repeat protein [Methanoregula sp.]
MLSVLVVDDETDMLDLIRHFLERFGDMKVETTSSTKDALTMVSKKEYDAIVLDCYMPEITGLNFLKILRAKGDTTPIIMFTGVGREHAAIEALNNGADFFLQKGDDPRTQFRELVHMIQQARDRRSVGRSLGTSQRIISDVMSFSPDPMVAIDREGKVVGWNNAMEELSGVLSEMMVGKNDHEYAVPFFGRKVPMLIDLIFASDEEIAASNYNIVSKEKGMVIAWIRAMRPDKKEWTLWMRAMPLYDGKGTFIGAVSSVRDITDLVAVALKTPSEQSASLTQKGETITPQRSFIDRITGKAKAAYRQGVRYYYRETKYDEAIRCFDRAIEIDPNLAHVWNDRGLCFKEMGKFEEAQKSFERALELAPKDEEYLYDLGEVLETIGVLRREGKILAYAIRTFASVTEINPNNANAWNHLGVCLKEVGKEEESRNAFERARNVIRANKDRTFMRKRESVI